jgi:hypothetical protein
MTNATWDPASVTAVTLSGGNLVATNTGTNSTNQGARAATVAGQTAGKYYFELKVTTWVAGFSNSLGIGTTASTYDNMGGSNATVGANTLMMNGNLSANGVDLGINVGGLNGGPTLGIAVDLTGRKIWFRNSGNGNWNSAVSSGNNPATNVGGITVPAGTMVPFVTFGGFTGASGNVVVANFGDSAFNSAVPSGYTAGWPIGSGGGTTTQARAMVLA